MSTSTNVSNLKINKLTKAQFDTIIPSATEAYELTDLSSILDAKQTKSNLVTTISASSTDAQYPSAKCVYDAIQSGGRGGLSYSATCPAITIASGIASWSVTHNLGTTNVIAMLYNSSGAKQECNIVVNSANVITVSFKASSNVTAGSYTIVVFASGASSDTSNLADKNLSNVTDTAKILMSEMGIASNTYEDLTLGASGTVYTAPANGWVLFQKSANATLQYCNIYCVDPFLVQESWSCWNNQPFKLILPVKKGQHFFAGYNAGGSTAYFRFYYAIGSESEAS